MMMDKKRGEDPSLDGAFIAGPALAGSAPAGTAPADPLEDKGRRDDMKKEKDLGTKKILLRLAYDGQNYAGWQIQPNCPKPTLQGALEAALAKIEGRPVRTLASGRTDAGVHALDQPLTFKTRASVPDDRWPQALNPLLADDMVVLSSRRVKEDFHVIRDLLDKTYRYRIQLGQVPDVFQAGRAMHYRYPLDLEAMDKAARLLVGRHNFRAFSSANSSARTFVRTVLSIDLDRQKDNVDILVRGRGFLYNMVRILVGSMVEVSEKRKTLDDLRRALAGQDRRDAGRTAPAAGLFLQEVRYPPDVF